MIVELTATACYCRRCYVSDIPSTSSWCGGAPHAWVRGDVLVYRAVDVWGVVRQETLPVGLGGLGSNQH